jgi:methylamine dehydrogenase accessory protein MauD
MTLLTIATAIQFIILIGLAVVVLSLARQVGILHERLSPAGMQRSRNEIQPGEVVPTLSLAAVSGVQAEFAGKQSALLFTSAECPICRSVLPAFEEAVNGSGFVSYWVTDGMPGPSGAVPDYHQYAADNRLDEDRLLVSQELALTLGVQQIPALVLIDSEQKLIARELLKGPRQVASLFAAYESSDPA